MIDILDMPPEIRWVMDCTSRNYYQALWSTLVALRPIHCLEIGTFHYYSANVFSHYFHEYAPDGKLITLDISTWNRSSEPPTRVYPLMVYPHIVDIENHHGNINVFHKNYKKVLAGKKDANILNSVALHEKMASLGVEMFDITFVDGSHDEISALADLDIAKNFTKPNGWILIDDIRNQDHALRYLYQDLEKYNNFYDFDNWNPLPDMGLINCGELKLKNDQKKIMV